MEFGLGLRFENGLAACLEYVDTKGWSDTLRVKEGMCEEDVELISCGVTE